MLNKFKYIILGVCGCVISLSLAKLIIVKAQPEPNYSYKNFEKNQEIFKEKCDDYQEVQKDLNNYINKVQKLEKPEKYTDNIYSVLPKQKGNFNHVISGDSEIRKMAKQVYKKANGYKMHENVYGIDPKVAAYLDIPCSYLFLMVDEKQENLIPYIAYYDKDDLIIKSLWSTDKSSDDKFVKKEMARLFLIYTNEVF